MTLLLTATFVGLLFLKSFIKLRTYVFYTKSNPDEATHVYIQGKEEEEAIVSMESSFIEYKKLKYSFQRGDNYFLPQSYIIEENFENILSTKFRREGLKGEVVQEAR